ncbi:HAD-superfamily phosphatase, subfamily IIIC/FkbH-like domain-containing protein [Pedobacter steynii]|uniref:HAD-superfamily phosphatase, subfamily IIIC/FkbH-like domain-containing protein n=1 Tax=Pedobacter steynii TaxID=430522 RepID=A0A1G9WGX7_9SPHI|nr:HAD-IIIC family phosphatase [Pedobacter steynii]NQX40287.1 HAD-IIIC family phosphatase [Pedobacter steynii]SDM83451.1 HAD-superfamily phosphatase, subfamily IIIC/FkbH-like domain-containing protein [Pedobacter steynii]
MITSLTYPFDISIILRKKKAIKRELLLKSPQTAINVAILGGSTTDEMKNILELFLLNNGFLPNFYQSEYNKFYEDAVFDNEELSLFKPDIILIHTSVVNITEYPRFSDNSEDVDQLLRIELRKFKTIWQSLAKYNCAIIQNNFDLPLNRSLGSLDCYDIHGKTFFISKLNLEFSNSAGEIKNLYINDINYLSASIGIKNWFDRNLWHSAKYAISFDSMPLYAHQVASIVKAIVGGPKKCLVLDLDNTCWGGIIGDDGLDGICLGNETAQGESFMYFQNYVKELKERGVILAVCSKNEHDLAKEGFLHPDSVLKFEDFTSFQANWEPKSENIKKIADQINIGLDSLVFIDDNSVEREIVSSQLPVVSVPDAGSDVMNFVDHIEKNAYFEIVSLSNDDVNRNKFYQDNNARLEQESLFRSYDEFLISLGMVAEIKPFSSLYIDRITQLINKTNQFNLTTKRYVIGEIEAISGDENYIKLYGKLTDKFGDNGLITILIGQIIDQACHLDLWLMSCRVLKRNMEFALLDRLVEECQKRGVTEIIGYYYRTPKNNMVAGFYKTMGFELVSTEGENSVWKLMVNSYKIKNNLIKIDNE